MAYPRNTDDPLDSSDEALAAALPAGDQLRLLIERIERLEEEAKGVRDDVKDVYGEAKSTGFDVRTMRSIIRLRKMEPHHRTEAEMLLATYKQALNMD